MSKISEMLSIQDQLNKQIHPDWKNQSFDWNRAIWVECAELMDKIGWKWWKHQEFNRDQAVLELVDIWHFILSELIRTESENEIEEFICDLPVFDLSKIPLLRAIENMAQAALVKRIFFVTQHFLIIISMPEINLSIDELFRLYSGKYTLNAFRQDNGYKDGSYRKIWNDGREDNEHLMDIIKHRTDSDDFLADVYADLQNDYNV